MSTGTQHFVGVASGFAGLYAQLNVHRRDRNGDMAWPCALEPDGSPLSVLPESEPAPARCHGNRFHLRTGGFASLASCITQETESIQLAAEIGRFCAEGVEDLVRVRLGTRSRHGTSAKRGLAHYPGRRRHAVAPPLARPRRPHARREDGPPRFSCRGFPDDWQRPLQQILRGLLTEERLMRAPASSVRAKLRRSPRHLRIRRTQRRRT